MWFRTLVRAGILSCALFVLPSAPAIAYTSCGITTSGTERIFACRTVNNWLVSLRCKVKAWYYVRQQRCNNLTCKKVWVWTYSNKKANSMETGGTCKRGRMTLSLGKTVTNRRKINRTIIKAKWPWQNVCLTGAFARANGMQVNFPNVCR